MPQILHTCSDTNETAQLCVLASSFQFPHSVNTVDTGPSPEKNYFLSTVHLKNNLFIVGLFSDLVNMILVKQKVYNLVQR